MKTIRRNTFETNSSSTHCVTICYDKETFKPVDYTGKTLTVYPGEFGWEIVNYSDFEDKASYAYTYAVNHGTNEDLENLKEVILKHTHADEVIFAKDDDRWHPYGYIDHQSVDEAAAIFETSKELEQFLFNEESSFHTDNDNY